MSTALTTLAPPNNETRETASLVITHARADFVAQFIAISSGAPQTRVRRRAEPEEALAAYVTRGTLTTARSGDVLIRLL